MCDYIIKVHKKCKSNTMIAIPLRDVIIVHVVQSNSESIDVAFFLL